MKKRDIIDWLNLLGMPVLTMVLGLILLLNPDSASAFVAKGLAWLLLIVGVAFGLAAAFGDPSQRMNRGVWAALGLVIGVYLLRNPLVLAKSIGSFIGLVLLIQGGRDIKLNLKYNDGRVVFNSGLILAGVTVLLGIALVAVPMTTSRLLFTVCGVVLICVGVAELFDRIRRKKYLGRGDDSDIIDAL